LVRRSTGTPVSEELVALALAAEQRRPTLAVTDVAGEVTVQTASGDAKVAVLTSSGFGVASIPAGHAAPLSLVLDQRCAPFRGSVEDQSSLSGAHSVEIAHIVPYGASSLPVFSTRIDNTGVFEGCLPPGKYYIDTELDEVGGGVVFDLPSTEPVVYVATREATAKTEPPSRSLDPWSAGTVEGMIRDLPRELGVLAIGESTHGTAEYAIERARITLELAKTRPVRFILLEASFGETLALDRYVRTGAGDTRKAVAGLKFWMWDTEEHIRAVEMIRAHNKKRAPKERIGFLGTDVQMTAGAVDALLSDRSVRLSPEERAALAKLSDNYGAKWNEMTDDERRLIHDLLGRLAVPRRAHDTNALAAASIAARLALIASYSGPELEQMRVRDLHMAEMTGRLTDDGKHLSVVWAHMNHVTKRWMFGQPTMGTFLAAKLGPRYVALAMLSVGGSARAWDQEKKIGVVPHALEEAPAHSIEAALGPDGDGPTYVLFSQLSPARREWLSKLRYVRWLGGIVQEGGGWSLYDMASAFDGAVVFRSTTSTTPTPTGVRKATAN